MSIQSPTHLPQPQAPLRDLLPGGNTDTSELTSRLLATPFVFGVEDIMPLVYAEEAARECIGSRGSHQLLWPVFVAAVTHDLRRHNLIQAADNFLLLLELRSAFGTPEYGRVKVAIRDRIGALASVDRVTEVLRKNVDFWMASLDTFGSRPESDELMTSYSSVNPWSKHAAARDLIVNMLVLARGLEHNKFCLE